MDWDSLPTSVSSGAIDCAIAGQSITAKRLESVDFTDPVLLCIHRDTGKKGRTV